jgi:type IV pilus assembly protein PilM
MRLAGIQETFRSLFGGDDPNLVGVDISSSAVKILELSKRGDRVSVESFASEPLPANAVSDKQVSDIDAVAGAITRAVDRAKIHTRQAAVAVGGASVISKVIQMSAEMSPDEMDDQIRADAAQYVPYPVEEVSLDFHILGPTKGDPGSRDVLLAACRRDQVDGRLSAIEAAGLKPKIVDVEIYALENACQYLRYQMPDQGQNRIVAVVDVGATTTTVAILHNLQLVYTRDQVFGGRQLTEDVMRQFALSYDEALKAQKTGGLAEPYETELVPHFVADLSQQIDRSLQFFFAASHYSQVDQILLAGGAASLSRVERMVQEKLQVNCALAKPFGQMSIAARARPKVLAAEDKSLLVALGLASRAFD